MLNGKQLYGFIWHWMFLFPTKNITTAEGGMLTTNNKEHYNKIKKIIAHGIDQQKKPVFWHREAILPGHNYRLPNHLAA